MTVNIKQEARIRKKFCIVSTQRSGSTWLTSLLDSHPKIRCFDELFLYRLPQNRLDPFMQRFIDYRQINHGFRPWITFKYMNSYFDDYPGDFEVIGFKLMYNQLRNNPEVAISLLQHKYSLIHLVRENHLDVLLSRQIKNKSGISHSQVNLKTQAVCLDPSTLIKNISMLDRQRKLYGLFLNSLPLPIYELTYETLADSKNEIVQKIADFLRIPGAQMQYSSPLKKIVKGHYRDKIGNYEEIEKVLNKTRFSYCLEE